MITELKGPWRVQKQSASYEIEDEGGEFVAECWHRDVANLAAAAPELADALRGLLAEHEQRWGASAECRFCLAARAALSKAGVS